MQQLESKIKAVAEEEVEMLAIPIDLMDAWMSKYHTWKSFVMGTIQARFDELLQAVDQIAFKKLDQRLEDYLREKADVTDSTLINLSHEQIAQDLATSRVVISRLLKKLEHDERVLLYRNQIKLLKSF
jgi:CRP/FNR family transcriptional regulator